MGVPQGCYVRKAQHLVCCSCWSAPRSDPDAELKGATLPCHSSMLEQDDQSRLATFTPPETSASWQILQKSCVAAVFRSMLALPCFPGCRKPAGRPHERHLGTARWTDACGSSCRSWRTRQRAAPPPAWPLAPAARGPASGPPPPPPPPPRRRIPAAKPRSRLPQPDQRRPTSPAEQDACAGGRPARRTCIDAGNMFAHPSLSKNGSLNDARFLNNCSDEPIRHN